MLEGFHGARAEVGHSEQEQRQKWHVEQEKEELGGQSSKVNGRDGCGRFIASYSADGFCD
jgi:hypothetical protein